MLTTKQIQNIKLSDIDAERKAIFIEGRPPAYLDDFELGVLKNHLKLAHNEYENLQIYYLFFNIRHSIPVQVSRKWILSNAKKITGYSPKYLRRAGLQICAEMFGPEYLHDCFGLSLTHSARFGNPDDWIIEDIINDEMRT